MRLDRWIVCPSCHHKLNGHEVVTGEGGPEEGDVSICVYCAAVTVFNEDASLRLPTPEELEVFMNDARVLKVREAVKSVDMPE